MAIDCDSLLAVTTITAMIHIGLREKPYVLDSDGHRHDLPPDMIVKAGQYITIETTTKICPNDNTK